MNNDFLSERELYAKLEKLYREGFTQVKLPGGTSIDGAHYSGVILFQYNPENKKTYFLGMPYDPRAWKKGESTHTKKQGETPKATGRREVMEEANLNVAEEDLEKVHQIGPMPGKTPGTTHTKNFFLALRFTGDTFWYEGPNPIDPETAAPLWFPAEMFAKILWKGHQDAFKAATHYLMQCNKDLCMSLINLV